MIIIIMLSSHGDIWWWSYCHILIFSTFWHFWSNKPHFLWKHFVMMATSPHHTVLIWLSSYHHILILTTFWHFKPSKPHLSQSSCNSIWDVHSFTFSLVQSQSPCLFYSQVLARPLAALRHRMHIFLHPLHRPSHSSGTQRHPSKHWNTKAWFRLCPNCFAFLSSSQLNQIHHISWIPPSGQDLLLGQLYRHPHPRCQGGGHLLWTLCWWDDGMMGWV